jgi:hypothetical protein
MTLNLSLVYFAALTIGKPGGYAADCARLHCFCNKMTLPCPGAWVRIRGFSTVSCVSVQRPAAVDSNLPAE